MKSSLVPIQTISTTNVSSVITTGAFSSTYRIYLIQGNLQASGSAQQTRARMTLGSTPNTTSSSYRTVRGYISNVASSSQFTGDYGIIGSNDIGAGRNYVRCWVFNPYETTETMILSHMAFPQSDITGVESNVTHTNQNSYDGIQFIAGGGTFAVVRLEVYGLLES